jgi:hypothetical protein
VEFAWLPLQRIDANYNVFLQLLAAEGTPVAQHDGPPNGGYTPTSEWPPSEEIIDRHGLAIPTDLSDTSYRLIAGMYDPATGQRIPVTTGEDFVDLGTVTIQ